MTSVRLPIGGGVDRGQPRVFTFDGKPYAGFEGDSIASALLANGVGIVGRSFKYHRPRGIWGAWTEEPNAIVDVTRDGVTTPNLRATTEALENDLAVRSVNAAPTAAADRAALLDRLAPFLPAGFYYKTFLWPRWETFEGAIRAMAGLGRIDPDNRPPADNPQFNARCDLLVVGAGRGGARRGQRRRALGAQGFPHRRPSRDRRPARPSRRDDRRRRLARMGGERHQDGRSRRRPRDDANHGLWRLRRQSRLRLGAAGAAARRALAHPAKSKSSSRPARSSGRSSSPTTTGRA